MTARIQILPPTSAKILTVVTRQESTAASVEVKVVVLRSVFKRLPSQSQAAVNHCTLGGSCHRSSAHTLFI